MQCTVLYCTVMLWYVLYCTALYCTVLQLRTILCCSVSYLESAGHGRVEAQGLVDGCVGVTSFGLSSSYEKGRASSACAGAGQECAGGDHCFGTRAPTAPSHLPPTFSSSFPSHFISFYFLLFFPSFGGGASPGPRGPDHALHLLHHLLLHLRCRVSSQKSQLSATEDVSLPARMKLVGTQESVRVQPPRVRRIKGDHATTRHKEGGRSDMY